jgi:hypothetical protein
MQVPAYEAGSRLQAMQFVIEFAMAAGCGANNE